MKSVRDVFFFARQRRIIGRDDRDTIRGFSVSRLRGIGSFRRSHLVIVLRQNGRKLVGDGGVPAAFFLLRVPWTDGTRSDCKLKIATIHLLLMYVNVDMYSIRVCVYIIWPSRAARPESFCSLIFT